MNPFRAHTQYVQAQDAARQGGSNASLTGYNQMLLQLTEHRRRLKTVQSNERKAQLKREFLPAYASWIAGYLRSPSSALSRAFLACRGMTRRQLPLNC